MPKIYSYSAMDVLNKAVASAIVDIAASAVEKHNAFHLALAGGGTPKDIYELMAREPYTKQMPWEKTHIYFGDERCVPADHPQSNYRMAKEALLAKVPVPQSQVHPIKIDVNNFAASAEAYEDELKKNLPRENTTPVFDLILLGIGDDGHTASLFPGTAILHETEKWAAAVFVEKFNAWRISITYPVINAAQNIFIIAAGDGKKQILKEVLLSEPMEEPYPVQRIQTRGELTWYLDAAAAALLPKDMLTTD